MKPALAAEEWKERAFRFEYYGEAKLHTDGALTVRDNINQPAILRETERHKLAALALHGQSFGFTHDDVAMLRTFASPPDLPPFAPLLDLADRIEALLPKSPQ